MKVAAVTMAYNEPDFLPVWAAHYSRQLGARHCYVIDHGSDDSSTAALGEINVAPIPRTPQDDPRRARLVSRFCATLLDHYDWVIHADVDELVLADPRFHASLAGYCETCRHPVVSAVGFNVQQLDDEPPLDLARPISAQREWVRFTGSMCKPVLIRRPVTWLAGFHRADAPIVFDQLFLFHLRWCDRGIGLRRLAKTRAMPWADAEAGWWQRVSDERCLELFAGPAGLPRRQHVAFDVALPPMSEAIRDLLGSAGGRPGEPDTFQLNMSVDELWPIPPRFRERF